MTTKDPAREPPPEVGDEVLDGRTRAIVTDIRGGIVWLRAQGRDEWPADRPERLTVTRTRAERIKAGDGDL
ncbi:hypothetical protein [Streptomyces sp. MST-110588]|uniref:hypothetical protein n=1 Tax=Streptomyces sp. MST-110588 TaxID=2833628 RepID=UPI001F5DF0B9|nr:hypothetical protein [Streptomyces sp. MST-110588]UNO44435.1 hypothetical protein KGS77_26410 [Streptomyces sp. MST-110588]